MADPDHRLANLERAYAELAAVIRRVNARAVATRSTGFRIPIVDADPDPDDPTNIWMFDDGRLRIRGSDDNVHEFVPLVDQGYAIESLSSDPAASTGIDFYRNSGSDRFNIRRPDGTWARYEAITPTSGNEGGGNQEGGGNTTNPKQPDPKPKQFRQTYAAIDAVSYDQHGIERGSDIYYGTFPGSAHSERYVQIFFDDAQIRSDLSGATIRRVEWHMLNTHSWYNNGVDVHLGSHNADNAGDGIHSIRKDVAVLRYPKNGDGEFWRDIPDYYGRKLRDGGIQGVSINQPSSSKAYYGSFDADSPRLRIHYTK